MSRAILRASSRRPEHKLKAFTVEMSPTPRPDCLGLISNSDKTGSGQEHDLSYRIMVDAGLTPAGLDYCRSRVPSPYCFRSGSGILAMRLVAREQIRGSPATGLLLKYRYASACPL